MLLLRMLMTQQVACMRVRVCWGGRYGVRVCWGGIGQCARGAGMVCWGGRAVC